MDYKILTKILANRLKKIIPNIISEEQKASIPQRNIFNNLFLTRDLIRYSKEKNAKFYILQIDQEKVFDKTERDFLYQTMEKMGFSETFISFIKILYKHNTPIIINNGYLSVQITLYRGLRQGCPLSLPLYIIQGEVTTQNINKKPQIQAVRIPNKKEQIKLSQYADDSNFFLKNTKSIQSVLTYFDKVKSATGSTINLEKSTVLPINTNDTKTLKQTLPTLKIKQQYQTTEVLGITFCKGLKQTTETNWQRILGKIENHIKISFKTIITIR